MAGKIQNADVKSEAELIALGATRAQLTSAEKIYSPKTGETVEERMPVDAGALSTENNAKSQAIKFAIILG
jgi:hypothetical protein